MQTEKGKEWKLCDEMILLGSDVKALFPSLSAEMTGKCVREQFKKSTIEWQNVDWKLVALYVKLHQNLWVKGELSEIEKCLPERKSVTGRPPCHYPLVLNGLVQEIEPLLILYPIKGKWSK